MQTGTLTASQSIQFSFGDSVPKTQLVAPLSAVENSARPTKLVQIRMKFYALISFASNATEADMYNASSTSTCDAVHRARISTSKTRAHANFTREVINTFYMSCSTECVLNPTQSLASTEVSKYAAKLLNSDMHKTFALLEKAWMAACRVCRARDNNGALSTLQDMAEK
eukprot:IDg20622t1